MLSIGSEGLSKRWEVRPKTEWWFMLATVSEQALDNLLMQGRHVLSKQESRDEQQPLSPFCQSCDCDMVNLEKESSDKNSL